jgi:hypothetical protein
MIITTTTTTVMWYFVQLFLKVKMVRYNKHIPQVLFATIIPNEWCKGDITFLIFFKYDV